MGRSPCCDNRKVKRGTWSPDEDATLKNYLQKHGTGGNWITLPQKAGLMRCGKSCRLRWLNYLRPDIKHGPFTQWEEYIIFDLYNKIGSRWSVIASNLPGRTDNDVKNYWNTKLKKKLTVTESNRPPRVNTKTATAAAPISITTNAIDGIVTPSQASIPSPSRFVAANDGIVKLKAEAESVWRNSMKFPFPRSVLEGSSSCENHWDSYPVDEYCQQIVNSIWSQEGDNGGDLFSAFHLDSSPY